MSLNSEIRQTIQVFRDTLPAELNTMIEQGAGEISALDIVENALKTGDKAPDFTLSDRNGKSYSTKSLLNDGPIVITFYRGAWCPFCNLQLAAYNSKLSEITAAGATLIALTPEKADGLQVFLNSDAPPEAKESVIQDPEFPVLHDPNNTVAKKFGLMFKLPESHIKILNMFNLDIEKVNGDDSYAFPDPATYIVDQSGTIRWAFVPNNYRKRAEPDEIIKQLKAL